MIIFACCVFAAGLASTGVGERDRGMAGREHTFRRTVGLRGYQGEREAEMRTWTRGSLYNRSGRQHIEGLGCEQNTLPVILIMVYKKMIAGSDCAVALFLHILLTEAKYPEYQMVAYMSYRPGKP